MNETVPNHENGNYNAACEVLRTAFNNNDIEQLRTAVNYIQEIVSRGGSQCSPMSNAELKTLLDTGEGTILVGTGTLGERIFIKAGEIYMPIPDKDPNKNNAQKYQLNFKRLFDLPLDDPEPKKKF